MAERMSVGAVLICAWLIGCVGTDTGNPTRNGPSGSLGGVQVSGCKSHGSQPDAGLTAAALTASDAHHYDGLQCLRWEREGSRMRFEAFNFSGGCEVAWAGKVERNRSGALDLVLRNPSCNVAACGSCLYDAAFELDTQQTPLDAEARVGFETAACDGKTTSIGSWQLQAGDSATGVQCTYAHALVDHAGRLGLCGKRDMPCRDRCGDRQAAPCDPGLQCSEVDAAAGAFTCLAECTRDDDCAVPEVMTCQAGLCRLREQ